MRKIICFTAGILAALLFVSCEYHFGQFLERENNINDRVVGLSANVNFVQTNTKGKKYSVPVVTDVHFGRGDRSIDNKFLDWIDGYNGEHSDCKIAFVVCLGDVVEHGSESEYKDYAAWVEKIEDKLDGGHMYTAVGNHDLFSNGWNYFVKYVNRNNDFALDSSFFSFNTGNFNWYFIDTGSGTMGKSQFKALKSKMLSDGGPKIVCSHYPVYSDGKHMANYYTLQNSDETTLLIDLCARSSAKLFMSGHTHRHVEKDFGKFREVNFPGFIDTNEWGVVVVDESAGSVSVRILGPGKY